MGIVAYDAHNLCVILLQIMFLNWPKIRWGIYNIIISLREIISEKLYAPGKAYTNSAYTVNVLKF